MAKSLADKLRQAIQAEIQKGRSLRDIARAADLAPGVVQKFMAGKTCTIDSAEAMAKAVGFKLA